MVLEMCHMMLSSWWFSHQPKVISNKEQTKNIDSLCMMQLLASCVCACVCVLTCGMPFHSYLVLFCDNYVIGLWFLQLSYDYQFDVEDDANKIPCNCGAWNCRKWMNWRTELALQNEGISRKKLRTASERRIRKKTMEDIYQEIAWEICLCHEWDDKSFKSTQY